MLADKIKPKIRKAISKLPTEAIIKRTSKNDFGEPTNEEIIICKTFGLYHEGNSSISKISKDKGEVKRDKDQYLMLAYDEEESKIKEGDFLYMKGSKYVIEDLGNQYMLDSHLDMKIKLVKKDVGL
ncbi:hypothetical protein [Clostridioides sp. ES-W-0016-02]|uniref:hypothetical protein n=1 Tax=Clostridioides sp. ES-W-0016-02 TaxID=2770788 RepID=UPI001D11E88E|nr:hypothetical protein IC758_10015 [Clostridioides sp. ES-W-0016-02]